jgi:hypothetical protein
MNGFAMLLSVTVLGQIAFQRHDIDAFPGGYQVAVTDVNGDGRPDVVALSTRADRVDWYANPNWQRHPVARTAKNIDLAFHDVDGDGRLELAIATGFYFSQSRRGGEIFLLRQPSDWSEVWPKHRIGTDPVVHRVRWGDVDGDRHKELVHAPIFGPGSDGARQPTPAHLWAFHVRGDFERSKVQISKIDETLTVLHGLFVGDLDADGRDEVLTASFEGIYQFDLEGQRPDTRWEKTRISGGAAPTSDERGAARGSSEIVPGQLSNDRPFIAAIEPWHGNQVVVYVQESAGGAWQRRLLDDRLEQGHAIVVADFDRDGVDEIVAGWRAGEGGLNLYDPTADGQRFRTIPLDRGIAVEGAVAADINRDGQLDLVAVGGRTNDLVWYENRSR